MLARMGLPRERFIAILERLSETSPGGSDGKFGSYFSTHPGIGERIERLEAGKR